MSQLYQMQCENTKKKCNNMRTFISRLCNKCKLFTANRDFQTLSDNLPFPQRMNKETDHPITSSNMKIPEQTLPENDPKSFQKQGSPLWAS